MNIDKALKKMMGNKKLMPTNFTNKVLSNFNMKSFDNVFTKSKIQSDMFSRDRRYDKVKDTKDKRIFMNPEGKKIIYSKMRLPKNQKLPTIDDMSYVLDELPPFYHDTKTDVLIVPHKYSAIEELKPFPIPKKEYPKKLKQQEKALSNLWGHHWPYIEKGQGTATKWGWEKGKPKPMGTIPEPGRRGSIRIYPIPHYGETEQYTVKGESIGDFKIPDTKANPRGFDNARATLIHEAGHSVHHSQEPLAKEWKDRVVLADSPTTYGSSTYYRFEKPKDTKYYDPRVAEDFAESFTLFHVPKTNHTKILPLSDTRKELFETHIGKRARSAREIAEEAQRPETLIAEAVRLQREQEIGKNAISDNDNDGLINAADGNPNSSVEVDKESKDKKNDNVRWVIPKHAKKKDGKIKPGYKWRVFPDKETGEKIGTAVFEGMPLKKAIEIVKQPWHKTEEEKIEAVINAGGQKSTARQAIMHARGRRGMPATSVEKPVTKTEWELQQEGIKKINTIELGEGSGEDLDLYEEVEEWDPMMERMVKVTKKIDKDKESKDYTRGGNYFDSLGRMRLMQMQSKLRSYKPRNQNIKTKIY